MEIHKHLSNTYLAFNFIVGSIYLLWMFLLYYNKCECSKHLLEKLIHVYWYVIFIQISPLKRLVHLFGGPFEQTAASG